MKRLWYGGSARELVRVKQYVVVIAVDEAGHDYRRPPELIPEIVWDAMPDAKELKT